jgi:hypothetical protein
MISKSVAFATLAAVCVWATAVAAYAHSSGVTGGHSVRAAPHLHQVHRNVCRGTISSFRLTRTPSCLDSSGGGTSTGVSRVHRAGDGQAPYMSRPSFQPYPPVGGAGTGGTAGGGGTGGTRE